MRKRFLRSLLFVAVACLTIGLIACGEESSSGLKFELLENGTYEVSDFKGSQTEVVIPAEHKGKPVTAIGDRAFLNANEIRSLEIPDTVTSIGKKAFYYCDEMIEISIPDSVVSIGERAFEKCYALTDISLPDNLTAIEAWTFYGCEELHNLVIPESVKTIGDYAFYACRNLVRIDIPESVESIGAFSFCACNRAVSINISNSVKTISRGAFSYCRGATWLAFPDSVEEIGDQAFGRCSSLTTVEIPETVKTIGAEAFAECESLTDISLPDGVQYVAPNAFDKCEKLNYTASGEYRYLGNANNPYLYLASVPKTITQANIDERCKIVGNFSKCENLTNVVIPEGVKTLTNDAFSYCYSLKSVTLPNSLEMVGASAFYCCTALTEISFPAGLKTIGNKAFDYCQSLTSVSLPNSIEQVGSGAFPSTVAKTQENGLSFLGNESNPYLCLVGTSNVDSVRIPAECKVVAGGALGEEIKAIQVDEGNTVFQSIDGNLYTKGGETLIRYAAGKPDTRFIVPSSVKEIVGGAFTNCDNLGRLMIGANVERISGSAISGVGYLTVYCKAAKKPIGWESGLFSNEELTFVWNNSSYYLPNGELVIW